MVKRCPYNRLRFWQSINNVRSSRSMYLPAVRGSMVERMAVSWVASQFLRLSPLPFIRPWSWWLVLFRFEACLLSEMEYSVSLIAIILLPRGRWSFTQPSSLIRGIGRRRCKTSGWRLCNSPKKTWFFYLLYLIPGVMAQCLLSVSLKDDQEFKPNLCVNQTTAMLTFQGR